MTPGQESTTADLRLRASLYIDAARHVKLGQLLGRPRRLVPPRFLAAGLGAPRPADHRSVAAGLGAPVAPQSGPQPEPVESGQFSAYGVARPADPDRLWEQGSEGLLYLFHLHGFSDLAAYAAGDLTPAGDRFWARIVASWLSRYRTPTLPAWHPYPTSLRLIAWCSAVGRLTGWPDALRRQVAGEIHRQADYLRRAIEHDIGGNHVLTNATAVIFAGATLGAPGALSAGLGLLRRELGRQILPDGAHEERSTAYHREIAGQLAAVSELLSRAGQAPPGWLLETGRAMERWMSGLTGPDGRLPLLNDAWDGPARRADAGQDRSVLASSGYVTLRAGRDQVVVDCGPLCPPHLPPHAHADALSFVLWMDGRALIVDPGSYSYTGPERDRFRATAYHNTVAVDGGDQCVFWGDFRAGLLPRITGPALREVDGAVLLEGAHDGYRRLADPTVHHRALLWVPGVGLVVIDRLACRRPHWVTSSLMLAPGVEWLRGAAAGVPIATLGALRSSRSEQARYAPYLGTSMATTRLLAEGQVSPRQPFGWSALRLGATATVAADGGVTVNRGRDLAPLRIQLHAL